MCAAHKPTLVACGNLKDCLLATTYTVVDEVTATETAPRHAVAPAEALRPSRSRSGCAPDHVRGAGAAPFSGRRCRHEAGETPAGHAENDSAEDVSADTKSNRC